MPFSRIATAAGWIALGALCGSALAFDDHVFVVTSGLPPSPGSCAAFAVESPWTSSIDLETTGPDTVVRHYFGLHYVVHRQTGDVQVIDPETFDTVLTFSVGASSNPHDIVVVASDSAYVSRHASPLLYEVDPRNGDLIDTVDLGSFADDDGIPDMSMMALDGHHLFVQIQRLDSDFLPVAPSYLAVVDVRTNQLVDADPGATGVQAIPLTGLIPGYKMQIEGRRLYVSEPGTHFDSAGGVDEIDLDSLTALGYITSEAQNPLNITGFVLTSPDKGYLLTHTDITLSSHLQPFSRIDGSSLGPALVDIFDSVDSVVHDPATDQLFLPDPDSSGVRVYDATTQLELTRPIQTGSAPLDVILARAGTPGEATELRVRSVDPLTEELTISYTPACGAADHTLIYGPLESVGSYGYTGEACGIGNSGESSGFDPGSGSYFIVIVGNDGREAEGSYGGSSTSERPSWMHGPACAFVQDLSLRCDRN